MGKKKKTDNSNTIAQNKKAHHDYFIEEKFEAGIALSGWEVKALRAGKGQLTDCYVIFQNSEAYLVGAHIEPLPQASTHFVTEPRRTRKLLLNRKEIAKLQQATDQKGYTVAALSLYWKAHLVKCSIGLAKGKHNYDKRESEKQRDWNLQKQRTLREHNR